MLPLGAEPDRVGLGAPVEGHARVLERGAPLQFDSRPTVGLGRVVGHVDVAGRVVGEQPDGSGSGGLRHRDREVMDRRAGTTEQTDDVFADRRARQDRLPRTLARDLDGARLVVVESTRVRRGVGGRAEEDAIGIGAVLSGGQCVLEVLDVVGSIAVLVRVDAVVRGACDGWKRGEREDGGQPGRQPARGSRPRGSWVCGCVRCRGGIHVHKLGHPCPSGQGGWPPPERRLSRQLRGPLWSELAATPGAPFPPGSLPRLARATPGQEQPEWARRWPSARRMTGVGVDSQR